MIFYDMFIRVEYQIYNEHLKHSPHIAMYTYHLISENKLKVYKALSVEKLVLLPLPCIYIIVL